jgi:hypothetical protein
MKRLLIVAISSLALTGCLKDFREDAPEQRQVYKDRPTGQGDPHAISCYRPSLSYSHSSGLECRYNTDWAQIAARDKRNGPLDIGNQAGGATVNVIHH